MVIKFLDDGLSFILQHFQATFNPNVIRPLFYI